MINNKNKSKGFTIIEVMIVLAIAGLIMLIVFLAVPALQRQARNTQRKNDAGNVASAISTWISNNNGALPGQTGVNGATCDSDLKSAINGVNLGYYKSGNVSCVTSMPSVCQTSGVCTTGYLSTENMFLLEGYICQGNTPQTTGATTRSYVLLYAVETGASPSEQCIEG